MLELPVHGKSSQLLYIHRSYLARSESEVQIAFQRPVEERILALQEKKRRVADVALGEANQAGGITREELLALLD